jgi:hypothetical protein
MLPGLSVAQTADFFTKADAFFNAHVANGKVDYKGIAADATELDALLSLAADISVNPSEANTYQAFWINAYNLAVIKGIVVNYPINSPLDKAGFFDKTKYNLGGEKITLNDIENKKLRAVFKDARVHFVLVCGAQGCPPLIGKAYTPDNVESLLQRQTELAVNNPDFIRIKGKKVGVSEIFKWYQEDFVTKEQTLIGFLNKYRTTPIAEGAKVSYYSYDWRLNAQ